MKSAALMALASVAACAPTSRLAKLPSAPPQTQAGQNNKVKIGNPYQVAGVWYYPSDDRGYDKSGIASWYGPTFHGKATANGEMYNENDLTAAHKTLPMPSWVEVTNLENGRSMVVRVNDRGPFVGDRIIDLSRRTAQVLDVERKGTARVRVRRVFPDGAIQNVPVMMAAARPAVARPVMAPAQPSPAAVPPVAAVPAVAGGSGVAQDASASAPVVRTVALPPSQPKLSQRPPLLDGAAQGFFIQVAALSDAGRANWLAGYLKDFGSARIALAANGLYRVQIGPFASADDARGTLARVQAAGYGDARMVADSPAS